MVKPCIPIFPQSKSLISVPRIHCLINQFLVRLLPFRAGSRPIDHALTYFNHVSLPSSALLGTLDKPRDIRQNFLSNIWRVSIGSLALSNLTIPAMQLSAYIAGKYSLRRTVGTQDGSRKPIFSFRTQQRAILYTLACAEVLKYFSEEAIKFFMDPNLDPRARNGIAAVLKVIMVHHGQSSFAELAERCGAQGLFEYNQIIEHQVRKQVNPYKHRKTSLPARVKRDGHRRR